MSRPAELRQPTKVSANIERPLFDLIKLCELEIRPLIERGFEASIPKGMSAWDYALSLKERDILEKRRTMDNLKYDYDKAKEDYDLAVKQKELMMSNSLDKVRTERELLDDLKKNAPGILLHFPIKQEPWRGDFDIIHKLQMEYKITITFDQLYRIYDELEATK